MESVDYNLDELERAAAVLRRTEDALAAAVDELNGSLGMLLQLGTAGDVAHALRAEWELQRAAHVCAGQRLAADLLSHGIARSRGVYEAVELQVSRAINRGRAARLVPTLLGDLATNHGRPTTATTEDLVNLAPGFAAKLLAFISPAFFPVAETVPLLGDRRHGGLFERGMAERLYPLLAGLGDAVNWVDVGPVLVDGSSQGSPEPFPGGLDAVLEQLRRNEADVSGQGAVLVASVEADGQRVHILTFPGTQEGSAASVPADRRGAVLGTGSNPFDAGGIVEGEGLGSQHVALAAVQALERAGAQPGDKLVVGGYSQGGIHAANVAVDPVIAEQYDVEYVVTVGAPVGKTPLPENVRGLHLENIDDPVPGADGTPNPDTGHQVTVYFEGYQPGLDRDPGGFGAAHKLENYRYLSRELAATDDASATEAVGALGAVFAGATTATMTTVHLRRSNALERGKACQLPGQPRYPGPRHGGTGGSPAAERVRRGWAPGH